MYLIPLNYTLKKYEDDKLTLCVFYQNKKCGATAGMYIFPVIS